MISLFTKKKSWKAGRKTKTAIRLLEHTVNTLLEKIDKPIRRPDGHFRYKNPTKEHLKILKAVRIVSGLNSMVVLLEKGFTQEVGVIARTLNEFLTQIDFLEDSDHQGKAQEFQDLFFQENSVTEEEFLKGAKAKSKITNSRILAGVTRILEPFSSIDFF